MYNENSFAENVTIYIDDLRIIHTSDSYSREYESLSWPLEIIFQAKYDEIVS